MGPEMGIKPRRSVNKLQRPYDSERDMSNTEERTVTKPAWMTGRPRNASPFRIEERITLLDDKNTSSGPHKSGYSADTNMSSIDTKEGYPNIIDGSQSGGNR